MCIFGICITEGMKYQISSFVTVLKHTQTHKYLACSNAQPSECHMPGERSKAATNSTRSHFFKAQNWKELLDTGGEPVSLWSPLEQKSKMTCSNEKSFIMDERQAILSLNSICLEGKGQGALRRKISSENTKQSLWDDNTNTGVGMGGAE